MELFRKDVECTFGILKSRWRFLRNPIEYHDKMTIESAMHTACALHNMIIDHFGLDTTDWDDLELDEDEDMYRQEEQEDHEEEVENLQQNQQPEVVFGSQERPIPYVAGSK